MITLSLKETVSVIDNKLRLLETHNGYEYSSTQISATPQIAKQILLYSKQEVKDSDLAADGREKNCHITVKYGLHTDNAKEVAAVLHGVQPIRYKLGAVSMFTTNTDFNVLKVEIISPDLQRLNAKIKKELHSHPEREKSRFKRSASNAGSTTLFAETVTCSRQGLIHAIANLEGFLTICAVLFPSLRTDSRKY